MRTFQVLAVALMAVGTFEPAFGAEPPRTSSSRGVVTGRVRNVVTGQFLNNARVSVKGSDQVALTDPFGTYHLVGLPSGPIVIEVFYTDLDVQQIEVVVPEGGRVEQNVDLTSVARYGSNAEITKLDPFLVASDKETDAQAIAINEQRFAPNIKNVMSTDALGDVLGSSVGEFLKFIPGVTAEFDLADIANVSIRGIGGGMTAVTQNGVPASNVWAQVTRSVDLRSMSLNDVSRIEVTKVPTPSTAADSLAGSINLVGKSAFERSGALLRYGFSLTGNSDRENLTFKKTPDTNGDTLTYKVRPNANFDYTLPIGKNLGFVLTAASSNVYNEQHWIDTTWATTGTGTSASLEKPYLQSYTLRDGPRHLTRNTVSLKVDWRLAPHSVLSVGGLINRGRTEYGIPTLTFSAGTVGTPTPATGTPLSFDGRQTIGATGRGGVNQSGNYQLVNQFTDAANLKYRFDDGKWRIEASLSISESLTKRRNDDAGMFLTVNAGMNIPVRVSLLDIGRDRPGRIEVFDNNDQPVDFYNIANYRGTTANHVQGRNTSDSQFGNLDLRRRLEVLPFPSSFQVGGSKRMQSQDLRNYNPQWTYAGGPDLSPYLMQVYRNQDSGFGMKNLPWLSPSRTWSAFQADPSLYAPTLAQQVAEVNYRLTNSELVEETVTAAYLQVEAGLFSNRLRLLTGVRYERTVNEGWGSLFDPNAVFERNADGTFARNAAGQRIRKPAAGSPGSVEEVLLTRVERSAHGYRTYDGYYPSFHITYEGRENLIIRAAYAKTYGRPNFNDIIPRTTINEFDLTDDQLDDPNTVQGTLTVRNTALRPWSADNYDVSLEYYTPDGGLFSAGVFLKELKDFFGDSVRFATLADLEEVGLDPRYVGWNLSTKFNSGDARITGAEFNIRHSLRQLGRWGSFVTLFANATRLRLEGHQQASFSSFIPKSGNWGLSFNRKRVTATARWNYRGLDKRTALPAFGPDGFTYIKARTTVDLSLGYQLNKRLSLVGSVNNLLNEPQITLRYGSTTPDYARQFRLAKFGAAFALGIKGSF